MSKRGNEILLKARTHARASRSVETLKKIDVPEWDCSIFYWPSMSVDEKIGVRQYTAFNPDGSLALTGAAMLSAARAQVALRARDEFGERLFGDEDEGALSDTDPNVLERISNAMGFGRATLEDAEKN